MLKLLFALVFATECAYAQVTKILPPEPLTPTLSASPLIRISPERFCGALQRQLVGVGIAQGWSKVDALVMATRATALVIESIRMGHAKDYINVAALERLVRDGSPADFPGGEDRFLSLASLLGNSLEIRGNPIVIHSPQELRYLPFAQHSMQVLVLARDAKILTPARATKVLKVAKRLGAQIHVVWLGRSFGDAKNLAKVAAATRGVVVDLSHRQGCRGRL